MCGIAGFFDANSSLLDEKQTLQTMVDVINHRGPDDNGVYFDNGLALGHARLSIHDLSINGKQPMYSHSKRWILVFNGEIYNFTVLRKELSEFYNMKFNSHSDTEVLVNAIDIFGFEKTLKKCIGMFSLAAYSFSDKKLYLARDRFGEKPLYYGLQNNIFAFASELKSLKPLKGAGWQFDVDRDVLATYMRYGYVPTPYSIYKNIYKLDSGSFLTVSENLEINKHYYWTQEAALDQDKFSGTYIEAVDCLETQLKNTLRMQMSSDVPLGAFLSGGVDSSLIVALMQSCSDQKINTFSIGSNNKKYDESAYAKRVANIIGTNHTEFIVSEADALAVIPALTNMYDEPFADSSQIPTFLVSKLAKSKVTVALTGDAGDELFGGYNRYLLADKVWGLLVSNILRKKTFEFLPVNMLTKLPYLKNKYALLSDKLMKLKVIVSASQGSKYNLYKQICSGIHKTDLVLNATEIDMLNAKNLLNHTNKTYKEWMMFADSKTYMIDDILTKVDRAAMAVSLETRVPFLNHNIFEFAWSLPIEYKIKNGVGKRILRDILYKYVPKELIERPKMGFGIPVDSWLRGELKEWASDLLCFDKIEQQGYLNPQLVQHYWVEHQSGKRNWQAALWSILMFQSWLTENKL